MKTLMFLLREILKTGYAIESKLDALLRRQKNTDAPILPMSYQRQVDPLSQRPIVWVPTTLGDGTQILIRRSGNEPATSELPRSIEEI